MQIPFSITEVMHSTIASIVMSGIVVLFFVFSIIRIFQTAKSEKIIEESRWRNVSANMALYDRSRRIMIPLEADEILVGRHGSSDIRLQDMSVSRYHAVLYVSNGVWSLMDLDSKSGTYVNGKKIKDRTVLRDNDEISFGNKRLIIHQNRRSRNV